MIGAEYLIYSTSKFYIKNDKNGSIKTGAYDYIDYFIDGFPFPKTSSVFYRVFFKVC